MQMTLDKASKTDLIRRFNKLTTRSIIENQYPSIAKLSRAYGNEKVEKVTEIMLQDLNASFKGELSPDNVKEITVEINSGMNRNLSLEDIYHALRKIKTTQHSRKLSVATVMSYITKQLEERQTEGAKISLNQHLANKHLGRGDLTAMEKEKKLHRQAQEFYLMQKAIAKKGKNKK